MLLQVLPVQTSTLYTSSTMNEQELPHNDRDLQLARRIGQLLESKNLGTVPLGEDEFEQVLNQLKQHDEVEHNISPNPSRTKEMWAAILAATQPESSQQPTHKGPGARIISLRTSVFRIAIAASVLVAVAIGWLLIQTSTSQPVLLAEAGSSTEIYTLDDGSSVTLRPNSSLYALGNKNEHVHLSLEGEAFFDVTQNPERTFSVEAGVARVSVLGTSFYVVHRSSDIEVFLEEGRISLTNLSTSEQRTLSPGQAGLLNASSPIRIEEPKNNLEYSDWLMDRLEFDSTLLVEIVRELEFHFSTSIEIPEHLNDETLTGYLPLTSLDSALESLSFIMGSSRFEQTQPDRYKLVPIE